ncbi:hypothetical protein T261_1068 [Streptomyces lydicus]|nr:hypothetical protein T261_1068 [Streptomyces lydicus]
MPHKAVDSARQRFHDAPGPPPAVVAAAPADRATGYRHHEKTKE